MDKNKALQEFKKSSFYKALRETSRKTLLEKWEALDDEQIRKILFLTINESMIAHHIGQVGYESMNETQKKAMREMIKKLENANVSNEEKILNDIISNNGF